MAYPRKTGGGVENAPRTTSVTVNRYGFDWDGVVSVERVASDESFGYVLQVKTERQMVQIVVSPKGRNMRVTEPRKRNG